MAAPSPPNSAAATSSIVASRRNRLFGTTRVFGRWALTPFRSPFVSGAGRGPFRRACFRCRERVRRAERAHLRAAIVAEGCVASTGWGLPTEWEAKRVNSPTGYYGDTRRLS